MQMTWGDVWTVVFTGLLVVFVVLILLIIMVTIYGSIFHRLNSRKKTKNGDSTSKLTNTASESLIKIKEEIPVSAQDKTTFDGVSPETVAAITAAVTAFTDGNGVITGIKPAAVKLTSRKTGWGNLNSKEIIGSSAALRNGRWN
ncbi:MAG: OadG family protein [Ruminococcus sp.]|jgi:Na+-transporting methylmalonyl-CoA/oxaloacetate decarboxylase gamma subunit|nr:OadG family protein [Ruminococcus sp.]